MASWALLQEQTVWISPRATSFSVVCEACIELDVMRGTVECARGHRLRVEREGR